MNLIKLNDEYVNLDHIVQINFDEKKDGMTSIRLTLDILQTDASNKFGLLSIRTIVSNAIADELEGFLDAACEIDLK